MNEISIDIINTLLKPMEIKIRKTNIDSMTAVYDFIHEDENVTFAVYSSEDDPAADLHFHFYYRTSLKQVFEDIKSKVTYFKYYNNIIKNIWHGKVLKRCSYTLIFNTKLKTIFMLHQVPQS